MASISIEKRLELREANLRSSQTVLNENQLQKLDGTLKKNSTFVRKLRSLSAEHGDALKEEFKKLRLSKYTSEAASLLLENKFKNSAEVVLFLEICTLFNCSYADFSKQLIEALVSSVSVGNEEFHEKIQEKLPKLRINFRLLAELELVGIVGGASALFESMKICLSADEDTGPKVIPLLNYFLKHLKSFYLDGEGDLVAPEWQVRFSESFSAFFKSMTRLLVRAHNRLQNIEQKGKYHYENKGDLSDKQLNFWTESKSFFESLHENMKILAENLDITLPELALSQNEPKIIEGKIVFADLSIKAMETTSKIFDSEEDRSFYEDLVDLGDRVPSSILPDKKIFDNEIDGDYLISAPQIDPDKKMTSISDGGSSNHDQVDSLGSFIAALMDAHTSQAVDKLAVEFCSAVSKGQRKNFPDAIVELARTRSDLLPFIGRLLSTLRPYFLELTDAVCESVLGQFTFLFHRTEPIRATRARICRFIGELTKFRVMTQGRAFACLKRVVVEDFSLYNVDMACMLLESCGRFLFYQPESHARITNLIEIIKRKKASGMLDQNRMIMIENALYVMNPPETKGVNIVDRPILAQFIEKVLRGKLFEKNAEAVFNLIRSLDWDNPETEMYLLETMSQAWLLKESSLPLIASIVGGLQSYRPHFVTRLVDELVEDVFAGLEMNRQSWAQRRIAVVKLIGELYNYGVVDADLVVHLLGALLSFGHPYGLPRPSKPSRMDPPEDIGRIRLVCVLLQSVGGYFSEGPLKPILDNYMVTFQYYICTKQSISLEVENLLEETFDFLRREIHFDEIESAVRELLCIYGERVSFLQEELKLEAPASSQDSERMEVDEGEIVCDDFDALLSGVIGESMEARKLEKRPHKFDVPPPIFHQASSASSPASPTKSLDQFSFKLILKKRNKPVAKELCIPLNPSMVKNVLKERQAIDSEMEAVRQRTLQSQAQEEAPVAGGAWTDDLLTALKQIKPPSRSDFTRRKEGPRRKFYKNITRL